MFREMRRHGQMLPADETAEILTKATSGVLAVSGDDGYPYAVPLSYVYDGGRIYFHCAMTGHKIDAIRREPKVSFCVIAKDDVFPEKFTTRFASVIAFGKAEIVTDDGEKRAALMKLAEKYSPGVPKADEEIRGSWDHVCVVGIQVEHVTGKEAVELTAQRKKNQE
ncbi:MAG: pyridoxamine 5'-phosphate oxidase family protein [Clostridia bacterium]|nr:pyridoxamine 5'-phosphate oxidase family protein [Clostridia bacterium]MBQ8332797.1 pyridoxamine 5'-phosphate oxidase family protein [Clostridia bacterium]